MNSKEKMLLQKINKAIEEKNILEEEVKKLKKLKKKRILEKKLNENNNR